MQVLLSRFEAGGFKFEGTPLEHQVLPEELLRDWTANLTTILSYLKVRNTKLPLGQVPVTQHGVPCSGDTAEMAEHHCIWWLAHLELHPTQQCMRCSTALGGWVNDEGFSLTPLHVLQHTMPDSVSLMHPTQGGVSVEAGSMVTILMPVLQDSVPENTLLIYHTLHIPQQVDKPDKWESDRYLYPHVAQLNAAGRHVARQLSFHILDMEAMALQLPKEAMMADITHPGAGFLMQVPL